MKKLYRKGVTLAEVLVAVAILGMVFGLAKMGVDWMVSLGRQRVLLNAQWNGQVVLYQLTREVRNAKAIVDISSGSLTLSAFRPTATNGFADPTFLVTRATATVQYNYVATSSETYLQRIYTYPDPSYAGPDTDAACPRLQQKQKLLVNMLEPPVNNMWMFKPYGAIVPGAYEAVEILIRLRPSFLSQDKYPNPIEYRTISMKRTSTS